MVDNITFFLDCGAFTAHSKGTPIVLDDYIAFIKKHEALIDMYPVLDVIGDVEATWKNQQIMEDADLIPMPVFHVEDDMAYLHDCLGYDYFCLGGMAGGVSQTSRITFLNKCFEIICDTPDNKPKTKVHGFGLASPSLMTAYPFYSIDTSSWVAYSMYGNILIPPCNPHTGALEYHKTPKTVFVSTRSKQNLDDGAHINTMPPKERDVVLAYIKSLGYELGSSEFFDVAPDYVLQENEQFINYKKTAIERTYVQGVSNNNKLRTGCLLNYYQRIAEACPEYPWAWTPKVKSLF